MRTNPAIPYFIVIVSVSALEVHELAETNYSMFMLKKPEYTIANLFWKRHSPVERLTASGWPPGEPAKSVFDFFEKS